MSTEAKKVSPGGLDRAGSLEESIARIEKKFGKGTIMRLRGGEANIEVEALPSGILSLDLATGIGGFPRGRVIEIFGPESSGKTTVALHAIAETQRAGGSAAFIDVEHSLDPYYARKLGVDLESLLVSQPDWGEQALQVAEALIASSAIDIVCVDSVAALVPRAEIEGEMGDAHMALQARLMSQALRKLTASVSKTGTLVIFINQLREVVNASHGPTETTTGGRALKFYASMRLDVRKRDQLKNGSETIGYRTRVKVVKNKVAPPFKEAEFDLIFGEGASRESCLLNLGVQGGLIEKTADAWYSYGEERLGKGYENARAYLKDNPGTAREIEMRIKSAAQRPAAGQAAEAPPLPAPQMPAAAAI